MKNVFMVISVLVLMASVSSTQAVDYFVYGGHTYFLTEELTWTDAEAAAVAAGGHLVTVNDVNEHDWLALTFPNYSYWIGFYRTGDDFVWASGEPVTFTNWVLDEPSLGDEFYVAMNEHLPGGWNDLPADFIKKGIVEIPEPCSLLVIGSGLVGFVFRRLRA